MFTLLALLTLAPHAHAAGYVIGTGGERFQCLGPADLWRNNGGYQLVLPELEINTDELVLRSRIYFYGCREVQGEARIVPVAPAPETALLGWNWLPFSTRKFVAQYENAIPARTALRMPLRELLDSRTLARYQAGATIQVKVVLYNGTGVAGSAEPRDYRRSAGYYKVTMELERGNARVVDFVAK